MNSYRDVSIRQKLHIIIVATSAAALLVASVVFTWYDRSTFLHAKTQDLSAAAQMVGANSTAALTFGDAKSATEILSALQAKQNVINACIYDRHGRVFASYSRDMVQSDCSPAPAQGRSNAIVGSTMVIFEPVTVNGMFSGTVFIKSDLADLRARMTRFLQIDFLVLLGSLAVAFLLSTRLQRVISGPIRELADTALLVSSRENYSIRAVKRGNDEIGLLFDQFNSMLDRIQERDTALREAHGELETRVAERTFYLNALIENNPLAIMVLDSGQRIQSCNPAFQRLFQCVAAEEIGKPVGALFPNETILPEASAGFAATSNETPVSVTTRRKRKDGSYVDLELHLVPLTVNEKAFGSLGIYQDVTQRRAMEGQLRMAQKMEAVGRLSGGIAHDFNNLLGVILGYIQVIQRHLAPATPLYEYAEEIEKASQRAVSLTRQLLAFSRQQVLDPVIVNLNTLVSDLEKMLPRLIGEDVQLNLLLDPGIGQVKADAGQLEQIVMNLAVNARDAMPDGGALTIRTANVDFGPDVSGEHRGALPGPYVMLSVTDTGTGIDPEIQAHIFEPFYTTKERDKGTGLGLATVYGVVKQSGGYIIVESEQNKGASFSVYLPRVELPVQVERVTLQAPPTVRGSETVLLVEDAEPLRKLARMILTNNGYRVLTAEDGAEAQRMAAEHTGVIDLLLTDVVMPGINGRVLAERLAPQRPAMKVLYISGYTDSVVAGHGVLEKGIHLLHKPFTEEVLLRKLRQLLDPDPIAKSSGPLRQETVTHGEAAHCR